MAFRAPSSGPVDDGSRYSAQDVSEAVATVAKRDDADFLTHADVEDIAMQVGVPAEAVQRELAARKAAASRGQAQPGPVQIEATGESLKISVDAPGWRAPIVSQFVGVLAATSISMYCLRSYFWWWVGASLFWFLMTARAASAAFKRTSIGIDGRLLTINTHGWFGGDLQQIELSPDTKVSIQRDVERMTIDFFPEHYLLIEGKTGRVKALAAHDPMDLERVKHAVLARL
jgi:hypothetical protein